MPNVTPNGVHTLRTHLWVGDERVVADVAQIDVDAQREALQQEVHHDEAQPPQVTHVLDGAVEQLLRQRATPPHLLVVLRTPQTHPVLVVLRM